MDPLVDANSESNGYRERVRSSSLSELEDMYTHVDRSEYPDRVQKLREEIGNRLTDLEGRPDRPTPHSPVRAGVIRRLWASLVDLFIHLLILGALFLAGWSVFQFVSGRGTDGPSAAAVSVRRGPSPLQGFVSGLLAGDAAAWSNGERWSRAGLVVLFFLILKALLVVPALGRTGDTPGMREAGIRLARRTGEPVGVKRALARFCVQYPLFWMTLGISALWMIWDRRKQALHDKLTDTCVVREHRTWEKKNEDRVYD
jgi:uncharacterized RDD family membrane protein YckC